MGHYDECREGYCNRCGQANGYCEHTKERDKSEEDILNDLCSQIPDATIFLCRYCHPEGQAYFEVKYYNQCGPQYPNYREVKEETIFCPFCGNDLRIR